MASVATSFKRLFLRKLLWASQDGDLSLLDGLKVAAKGQLLETSTGKTLVGASANGHDYEWEIDRSISPSDVAEMIEELITRYEEAVAYLDDNGNDSPTDTQIYTEMAKHLKAVRSIVYDFGGSRDDREEESD